MNNICQAKISKINKAAELYIKEMSNKRQTDIGHQEEGKEEVQRQKELQEAQRARFLIIVENLHSGDEEMCKKAKADTHKELSGFIGKIIKARYSTYIREYYDDMYQSGVAGLYVGLPMYNPNIALPTTFFESYIIHEISDFINKGVHNISPYYANNMRKVNRAVNKFNQEGRNYTINDLAVETGLNIEKVKQAMQTWETANVAYYDSDSALEAQMTETYMSPEEAFMKNEMSQRLFAAMKTALNANEREIIYRSFGFVTNGKESCKSISEKMGIPVSTVRRIKATALKKLQMVKALNTFRDYTIERRSSFLSNEIPLASESVDLMLSQLNEDVEELDF